MARFRSCLLLLVFLVPAAFAQSHDAGSIEPDAPGQEQMLNRQIWEYMKGTSYAAALLHVHKRYRGRPAAATTLPNGWKCVPAGAQIDVGRMPYTAAFFAGKLVVLNNGYYTGNEKPEVSVVDPIKRAVVRTLHFDSLFPSVAVGDSNTLYISGGYAGNVYRLDRRFDVTATYTVDGYAGAIAPLDAGHIAVTSLVTGKNEAAYKSGVYEKGSLSVIDTGTGAVQKSVSTGYFPVDLQVSSGKLYALLEGENRIEVYDSNLNHVKSIPVGEAPVSIAVDQGKLYAANSGSDSISVIDTTSDNVSNTLHLNTTSTNAGEAPTSCAFSGANIYVTLAGENAVAVLSRSGKPLGKIPTGWYPTRVLAADGMLIVLNAKGIKPRRPNIDGPQPLPGKGGNQYVLTLLNGTVSVLQQSAISAHLGAYSRSVAQSQPAYHLRGPGSPPIKYIFYIIRENRTYDQDFGDIRRANGDPYLTIFGNAVTPNAHAIARRFVTLDNFFTDGEISVLGHSYTTSGYAGPFLQWLGNAAYSGRFDSYPFGTVPAATSPVYLWDALERNKVPYKVFGENYYVYARARRIIDSNFGASSEMAAKFYAQMMALAAQTDRGKAFYNLASRYALQAATPAMASDLLDKAEFARSLSRFLVGDSSLATALATNPKLKADLADYLSHYSLSYASWNLHYSDLDRAAAWKADFEDQLLRGQVARLQYLWLPNDHTGGSNKAYLPPDQLVAQNDAALARIVQTISASTIWKQSLILVVEDDAQDGPDHVDATRTVALAAGPYVKRGAVVSDLYDQLSMLRTIEVLLGLPPLNSEDGAALPMYDVFTNTPDTAPYWPTAESSHLSTRDKQLDSNWPAN